MKNERINNSYKWESDPKSFMQAAKVLECKLNAAKAEIEGLTQYNQRLREDHKDKND